MPGTSSHTLVMMVAVAAAVSCRSVTGQALHVPGVSYIHTPTHSHGERGPMVPFLNQNLGSERLKCGLF